MGIGVNQLSGPLVRFYRACRLCWAWNPTTCRRGECGNVVFQVLVDILPTSLCTHQGTNKNHGRDMLVTSKVVSCISNPNYERNSFWIETWMMQQIRLRLTPIQLQTQTLHQNWYSCIKFVMLTHDESRMNPWWIHHESQVNAFHYTSLMSAFEKLGCQSMSCCSGMRSTEETDSLAKTFEHRRLDEAKTGGWVEPNWTDEWIDGLMLTLMDVFFSHQAKNSLHLWMQPQLKRHRRNPWFLEKQFPARFPAHMTWWFQWSELQAGRGGVFPVSPFGPSVGARAGVLGCGFSQRGPCSMCCWSTMGLGAELLGSSSCNAARCRSEKCTFFLGGLDLLCGHVNLYVDRHVLIQSNVTNVSRYAWTLNSFTVLDTFDGSLHALRRDRYG